MRHASATLTLQTLGSARVFRHGFLHTRRFTPHQHNASHFACISALQCPRAKAASPSIYLTARNISYEQKAKALNQQGVDEALSDFDDVVAEEKDKQHRAPWHREGVDVPPVRRQRSAGAMTKG